MHMHALNRLFPHTKSSHAPSRVLVFLIVSDYMLASSLYVTICSQSMWRGYRYFDLLSTGQLVYMKKKADEEPAGVIELKGCVATVDPEDDCAIFIQASDKQHHMKADTTDEAASWVSAISNFV